MQIPPNCNLTYSFEENSSLSFVHAMRFLIQFRDGVFIAEELQGVAFSNDNGLRLERTRYSIFAVPWDNSSSPICEDSAGL